MIKKFEQFNENVKYGLEPNEHTDKEYQETIANGYINQIEKAILPYEVDEVEGSVSESDCDLLFYLNDGNEISVNYTYHPNGGLMTVKLKGAPGISNEKSHGKANSWGSNYDVGKNPEYDKLNTGEDVYQMVKDMYMEEGLIELEVTHQIVLPKDSYDTDFFL